MAIPTEYKLAAGAVVLAGVGLYFWSKHREAQIVAQAALPPGVLPPEAVEPAPADPPWNHPPPSAFLTTGPVTRALTDWEKSVLAAYYRPELLGIAILHIGQWGQWDAAPAPAGAVAATLDRDIYFKDPNVLFTSPTSMSTLAHELFHVAEYATGMTRDQYRQGKEAAAAGKPETNPFEAPAYAMGQKVFEDLIGVNVAVSGWGC